jgi:predicted site-specific integrase-resolvase
MAKGAERGVANGLANGVAIYARVSTDDKGQTPDNQLLQLRAWCERMGHPVVREYVEHEKGGKGIEYRKQLAAMFAGAARREFDVLLVWSLDRFSREGMAATVAHLQRLASHGIAFRSFTEEHLSTENELVRNILLATCPRSQSSSAKRSASERRPVSSELAQRVKSWAGRNSAMVTNSSWRSKPATAGTG